MDEVKAVNREMLYNEVWTEPVAVVAPRYGLSDVGLAKICRKLDIPLPSRGYWAKVKGGKVMGRAPLPPIKTQFPINTGLKKLPEAHIKAKADAREVASRIRQTVPQVILADENAPFHPLVKETSLRLRKKQGWPKYSPIRWAPKEVLNLSVTEGTLERALRITDALLKALASYGVEVQIDHEKGVSSLVWRETRTRLEFSLTERVKVLPHQRTPAEERAMRRHWERTAYERSINAPDIAHHDYLPSGLLTLKFGPWPERAWNDTPKTSLDNRLGELLAGILALAQEHHAIATEKARKEELRQRAISRFESLTKQRALEKRRFEELETQALAWERAARLRAYADVVEANARSIGLLTAEQRNWLDWTRAKADGLDPLVLVSDPILDAPEPKRPEYF